MQVSPPRPVPISVLCLQALSALGGSGEKGRVARKQQERAAPREQPTYAAGLRLRVAITALRDTTRGPRFGATPQAGSTIRA